MRRVRRPPARRRSNTIISTAVPSGKMKSSVLMSSASAIASPRLGSGLLLSLSLSDRPARALLPAARRPPMALTGRATAAPAAARLDTVAESGGYYRGASPAPAPMTDSSADNHDVASLPIGMFDSGHGRAHRAARVPRAAAERELRLRGRHGALPLRREVRAPSSSSTRARSPRSSRPCRSSSSSWPATRRRRRRCRCCRSASPRRSWAWSCPGARAAVQTSRYRRIGVLATEATVSSGAYPRAIRSLDGGAEVIQQAAPGLVSFIEEGDVASQAARRRGARRSPSRSRRSRPDVVILGCTHYPLIAPMLQRFFGRDVTLVNPAAEIAREVEDTLRRARGSRAPRTGWARIASIRPATSRRSAPSAPASCRCRSRACARCRWTR